MVLLERRRESRLGQWLAGLAGVYKCTASKLRGDRPKKRVIVVLGMPLALG